MVVAGTAVEVVVNGRFVVVLNGGGLGGAVGALLTGEL